MAARTGHLSRGHSGDERKMAEREGFEPSIEFPLYTLSKRAPSTTRPSLPVMTVRDYSVNHRKTRLKWHGKHLGYHAYCENRRNYRPRAPPAPPAAGAAGAAAGDAAAGVAEATAPPNPPPPPPPLNEGLNPPPPLPGNPPPPKFPPPKLGAANVEFDSIRTGEPSVG